MNNIVCEHKKINVKFPKAIIPKQESIPVSLKNQNRWVNWCFQKSKPRADGTPPKKEWTKVPFNAICGGKASTIDEKSWAGFSDVFVNYKNKSQERGGALAGIGLILRDDFVGVDLDDCRHDGIIDPWAQSIIDKFDCYTEISPSGTGIRIICRGKINGARNRAGKVECYDHQSPRFLTITGEKIHGQEVEERQSAIDWLEQTYLTPPPIEKDEKEPSTDKKITSVPNGIQAKTIIERACKNSKFAQLWQGDWEAAGFNSQSEADLSLCGQLAFWVGPNEEDIDELFKCSGLMRDKWERDDYRSSTIENAISGVENFFDWEPEKMAAAAAKIDEIIKPSITHSGMSGLSAEAQLYEASEARIKEDKTKTFDSIRFEKWSETKAIAATQKDDWLWTNWAEFGCLTVFSGLPFSGKSCIIAELISAMATTGEFCGATVQQVPMILCDLENKERILVRRVEKALQGSDEDLLEELYMRLPKAVIPQPVGIDWLEMVIQKSGVSKGLLVIDTMRSAFLADSCDEQAMLGILVPIQKLAAQSGWCIIVLHHNAKASNSYSGSTAIAGVADYLWNWQRTDAKNKMAELHLEGRGEAQHPLNFQFDMVTQRNVFMGDCKAVKDDKAKKALAERQKKWLGLFVNSKESDPLDLITIQSKAEVLELPSGPTTVRERVQELFNSKLLNCTTPYGKGSPKQGPPRFWINDKGLDLLK